MTFIVITFPPFPPYTNFWANPFDNASTLTADPATPNAIGQEVVSDGSDGQPIASDPLKSYAIRLLTICP